MRRSRYINFNNYHRLKTVAKLYAEMLLQGSIDYNILYIASYNSEKQQCIMTIPNQQLLLYRVNKVLNNDRLKRMLADELLKIMKANGFSVADAINYRKQILEGAIKKNDFTNANRALDSFDDKLGISNTHQQQPLLPASGNSINLEHLSKVKQVNYKEIKQLRDSNSDERATVAN